MNINKVRSKLSKNVLGISFIFLTIISIFWSIVLFEYHHEQQKLINEQLNSTIKVYNTNLSEKLSIIASSPIFQKYLHSGDNTRDDLYIRFLNEILTLKDNSIVGMTIQFKPSPLMKGIEASQSKTIFTHGNTNVSHYVNLKLCYLNKRLNAKNGVCQYTWKIYLSKNKLVHALKNINSHIEICPKNDCKQINLIGSNTFGSFPVADSSEISLNLNIKQHTDVLLYVISIITIILLLLLAYLIRTKTENILNYTVTSPLKNIICSLKKGKLPNTENYLEEFKYLCAQISEYYKQKDKIEIAKIAGQAAHDMRSPLTALEIAIRNLSNVPDRQRILIESATAQISDIANNLLQKNVSEEAINYAEMKNVMLIPILDYVISEKKTELTEVNSSISLELQISDEAYKAFIRVVPVELKRILSNLVNNAIEAIGKQQGGCIKIQAYCINAYASIKIIDNGPGIDQKKLQNIFNEGVSFKAYGSGLGLHHAKQNIEQWYGTISIESQLNKGSDVTIFIPKQPIAPWFTRRLTIPNKPTTVVVVDDSESIFNVWQQRLNSTSCSHIELIYFASYEEFLSWYKQLNSSKDYIFLIDHEFTGQTTDGIDIIQEMHADDQFILVTSRAEDFEIQQRCLELNIKLIPKYYAEKIPIHIMDTNYNMVLIEPNPPLKQAWQLRAQKYNISLLTYNDIHEFMEDFKLLPKDTIIYVAEKFIQYEKIIAKHQFKTIYITSHNPNKYKLKFTNIIKKEPNFLNNQPNC